MISFLRMYIHVYMYFYTQQNNKRKSGEGGEDFGRCGPAAGARSYASMLACLRNSKRNVASSWPLFVRE